MITFPELPIEIVYSAGDDPLHNFYIPVLKTSVRYDRMTGFFTSTSLAIAAEGIAHLIARGGLMHMLVGAQLTPDDVEAIRRGDTGVEEAVQRRMIEALPDPDQLADEVKRHRLEALAWMIAQGQLQIKVVFPTDAEGLPLPATEAHEYFHPKVGIFTDEQGNQIAFSGSINETETGWRRNYEQFMVFRSWTEEGRLYVAENIRRFERLWAHREPGWIALDVPEAVRQRLLQYTPSTPPVRDPLEQETPALREKADKAGGLDEALIDAYYRIRYLQDAPYLIHAQGLGMATAVVDPWPHQEFVLKKSLETFPQRYLIADEVGLGKTIEAGLVVRQLYLSGLAKRILILAPKSVLRQWQEELYEKFALNALQYDGKVFYDYHGYAVQPHPQNPWQDVSLVLASSQLVKRKERKQVLLDAPPWDLIVVDEAHHARRKDFLNLRIYRPNALLSLLNELQHRTDMLLLLTATPMQVDAIELWDLLNLLGLSGVWAIDGQRFKRFFQELAKPLDDIDIVFVQEMVKAETAIAGLDQKFVEQQTQRLGRVKWAKVEGFLQSNRPVQDWKRLQQPERQAFVELARKHTPLRRLVMRHTRQLLRQYISNGLLDAKVAERQPHQRWIAMTEIERALYDRIDEYITNFYHKYEKERKGLGFVMTVYRRRLTSSFYAIRKSLERRLEALRGLTQGKEVEWLAGLSPEEDLEAADLEQDTIEELGAAATHLFKEEIEYLEGFLSALRDYGDVDSKTQRLQEELRAIFRTRETVIIFTQYTDTMDYLRDRLVSTYGSQVACYSGRGGERWDKMLERWIPAEKEQIKNDFRTGEDIKILVCTEAASEGLNLQTCGVEINYDMPWNPMRVEQRIGRIDRIGQIHDVVWIYNYFYEDTVEAKVYQALGGRINLFEHVLGPLQPILSGVERIIERVAMEPADRRERTLEELLAEWEARQSTAQSFNLDEWLAQDTQLKQLSTPVSQKILARSVLTHPRLEHAIRSHDTIEKAYYLTLDGYQYAITFDPDTYDAHPNTLHYFTYGSELWDKLITFLYAAPQLDNTQRFILRLQTTEPLLRIGWYVWRKDRGLYRIADLNELDTVLQSQEHLAPWNEQRVSEAKADFIKSVEREWLQIWESRRELLRIRLTSLQARAKQILAERALIALAESEQTGLFVDSSEQYTFSQGIHIVQKMGYPYAPLIRVLDISELPLSPADPYYLILKKTRSQDVSRRKGQNQQQAKDILHELAKTKGLIEEGSSPEISIAERNLI